MPAVVEREDVVGRPSRPRATSSHAMPSSMRPCISITCVTACTAQPSLARARARGAPWLRPRRTGSSPRARTRACRARTNSPAPLVPVRQHARDAVAQVERVAAIEVHQVRHLQRERVARMVDQHAVERRQPACQSPSRKRCSARIRPRSRSLAPPRRAARRRARPRSREQRLFARREHRERAEQVAHHEVGRIGERRVEGGDGVADVGLELRQCDLVIARAKALPAETGTPRRSSFMIVPSL